MKDTSTLFLFDVDGTLTPSREKATPEMLEFLKGLKEKVLIGFVGGSDLPKQKEQLGEECVHLFDFCFPENGLHFIKNGQEVSSESYLKHVGEKTHTALVNKLMEVMSKIDLPVKRGNFIETRNSMVNVSPVGRSCSKEEREAFFQYDKTHKVREGIVSALKPEFPQLTFSIGGQISIDIFPTGWDKTYCLSHIGQEHIKTIHFFGDMTHQGGNDYEIATHADVVSHTVTSPEDTIEKASKLLCKK
ncbi:phosphomannomutase [Nematocida sp. AWRm77]|nr:phosphomannomutase [Nematocida sp. AWRm77]